MFGMNLFDECVGLISRWQPKQKYPNELKYRDDLMRFLQERLNNSNDMFSGNRNILVKKEDGRGLCDIAIGNKRVGIELKKDLKSKSQINRLQGQIEDYEDDYAEGVIVVLVGNTDVYTENDLRHKLEKKLSKSGVMGLNRFRLKLINKCDNKIQQKPKQQNPFELNFRSPF